MLKHHLEASTHFGIKTMLGLHFIRPGLLQIKYGKIYQTLFDNRQAGDYEDFVYYDQDLFNDLRAKAADFIERLQGML